MFYLNIFFRAARSKPMSFAFFFLCTLSVCFLGVQRDWFDKQLQLTKVSNEGPFFHALISGEENHNRISRRLRELPGVESVQVLSPQKVLSEVKNVLNAAGNIGQEAETLGSLEAFDTAGLKVIFSNQLQERGQQMIRDYLERLVGKDNVTLGAIRAAMRSGKESQTVQMIKDAWFPLAMGVFGVFWLIAGLGLVEGLRKEAYLVEQYQRRNNVASKSLAIGLSCLVGIPLAAVFTFGTPYLMGAIVPVALCSVLFASVLRRFSWQ
jgi:hypothetical protein